MGLRGPVCLWVRDPVLFPSRPCPHREYSLDSTTYCCLVDPTRYICVWMHDCDPGRVSDGSRLTLYQTLSSIECPSSIIFCRVFFLIVPFFVVSVLFHRIGNHVPVYYLTTYISCPLPPKPGFGPSRFGLSAETVAESLVVLYQVGTHQIR